MLEIAEEEVILTVYDVQLPEEVILRLQANTDNEDAARWDDGEIAAELVDEFGPMYGKALVRKRLAIEAGIAASSLRQREELSRFFPQDVRDEFEILTWSQWRAIKPAGAIGWRELATWAIESADEYGGRPAPVDAITAKRLGDKGKEPPDWDELFIKMRDLGDDVLGSKGVPRPVRAAVNAFQKATAKWYKDLTEAK